MSRLDASAECGKPMRAGHVWGGCVRTVCSVLPLFVALMMGVGSNGRAWGEAAAIVGGNPVDEVEVAARVRALAAGRTLEGAALSLVQARAVAQLVNQELLRQYFKEHGPSATPAEVQVQMDALRSQLATRQMTIDALLEQQGLTEEHLRRELELKIASAKFVAAQVTDEELQDYFREHQQQFDDTRLRVSHILLRPEGASHSAAVENAVTRAGQLRERIVAGELTFEDAARKYSAGPSRSSGGDLGYIQRRGESVEEFAEAAFQLMAGEVSEPVATPFGIHLITVTDSHPGGRDWTEVREQLHSAVGEQKLQAAIEQQRAKTDVQFTGRTPSVRPGTTELVVPAVSP